MHDALNWILLAFFGFFLIRFFLAARNRVSGPVAREKVKAGALLLDVRSPGEFRGGAIPGAINIPVQSLGNRLGELDRARPIVVYCASGMRSASAASMLRKSGFSEVHDLGPAAAW
jgi:rhodanese-related sulfurtransferase